jgi:hypothetical protein
MDFYPTEIIIYVIFIFIGGFLSGLSYEQHKNDKEKKERRKYENL